MPNKNRFISILLCLGFALSFTIAPILSLTSYAQEAEEDEPEEEDGGEDGGGDEEEMETSDEQEDLDFINSQGEEEEYEDYVEEGQEVVIAAEVNERVKYFDIAGLRLGQDLPTVKEQMKEHKYKMVDIQYNIPKYFQFNYDDICRGRKIFIPENLRACIKGLARKDKMEYVSEVSFKKHDTKEDIKVYFTSPLTENKVWKIEYKNTINEKYGPAENFQYQREERRRAFWYFVLTKYGKPNVEPNKWVLDTREKENMQVALTAGFGYLTMANPKQYAFDIAEGVKQARRTFKYTDFSF